MVRRAHLRASDADRDHVAERLRDAAAEGRLSAGELEQRLAAALSARTYGQLDATVADLPPERAVGRIRRSPVARLRPVTVLALLVLFPVALAIAGVLLVAILALLSTWALTVAVAGLLLGSRVRALPGPWAVSCRAWRGAQGRRALHSHQPWW
jgi:hypothetical protein